MILRKLPFGKREKPGSADMTVELKVIGLMAGRYVNTIVEVFVPAGSSVKDLLKKAKDSGKIEKDVYRFIKGLKTPLSLMINGQHVSESNRAAVRLADGDKVTVFTALSGG
jgi:sulfur carrier protein ThiS